MTKKPVIAVDVDDVLAAINMTMMHFVNDKYGTQLTWEDYQVEGAYGGYWERVWDVSEEEAIDRYNSFISSGSLRKLAPIEGAIEAINHLKERFELVVITAREDEHAEDTHHWLNQHFPKTFRDIRFLPMQADNRKVPKAVVAQEVGASYLIDDNVEHCETANKAGIICLLFGEYGWNMHETIAPSITRVKDWVAVKDFFDAR